MPLLQACTSLSSTFFLLVVGGFMRLWELFLRLVSLHQKRPVCTEVFMLIECQEIKQLFRLLLSITRSQFPLITKKKQPQLRFLNIWRLSYKEHLYKLQLFKCRLWEKRASKVFLHSVLQFFSRKTQEITCLYPITHLVLEISFPPHFLPSVFFFGWQKGNLDIIWVQLPIVVSQKLC